MSWESCSKTKEFDNLSTAVKEAVIQATKQGYTKEEIYSACHKLVDIALYEAEIEQFL